ncbi:MAG: hypothetical protein J6M18_01865 [Actinomycetaceae bacterium]|nr:hypothetical protein [Actinomycetaceae bacterium]
MRSLVKKIGAVSIFAIALSALSACDAQMVLDVDASTTVTSTIRFVDDAKSGQTPQVTCDEIQKNIESFTHGNSSSIWKDAQWNETTHDGKYACEYVEKDKKANSQATNVIDNGSSITVIVPASTFPPLEKTPSEVKEKLNFSLTINMPGTIIEATAGYKIQGNTIVYEDPTSMNNNVIVTSKKAGEPGGTPDTLNLGEGSKYTKEENAGASTPRIAAAPIEADNAAPTENAKSSNWMLGFFVFLGVLAVGFVGIGIWSAVEKRKEAQKDGSQENDEPLPDLPDVEATN